MARSWSRVTSVEASAASAERFASRVDLWATRRLQAPSTAETINASPLIANSMRLMLSAWARDGWKSVGGRDRPRVQDPFLCTERVVASDKGCPQYV